MIAKRLHIGPGFTLPLDAITETLAVLGIRGSGKTNTAVVLAEELLAHKQQVVIIDPTDVWWGLKSSKDGTKAGYPIIVLGGRHADLPLAGGDGATIADFVVDTGASVILSLRHLESDAEKRRIITDFARRLYHRKGQQDNPTPIMVVIDEASLVVPQRVMGEDAKMVGSIQRLVRQGRSSGIGVNLIDARPATVNKDVLAGVEMLVVHRVTSPKDRKAVQEYVEQHDPDGTALAFLKDLAALPQGTAWFWSPGWLNVFESVAVRERKTFDSSRTPKPGEVAITPTKMADIDLEAVRAKLGQSIERAKAEDPKELKKKIAELEATIKKGGAVTNEEVRRQVTEAARVTREAAIGSMHDEIDRVLALERAQTQRQIDKAVKPYRIALDSTNKQIVRAAALAGELAKILETVPVAVIEQETSVEPEVTLRHSETRVSLPKAEVARLRQRNIAQQFSAPRITGDGSKLTGARLKIVRGLAELEAIGVSQAKRAQLSFYCGISFAGGYGSNTLGAMRTEGLIDYPTDGFVALTDAGRAAAGEIDAPLSLRDLHDRVRRHLGGLEERIFDAVVALGQGGEITREELGNAIGASFAGGYGSNTLGAMRTAGIIEYPQKGTVGPSDLLFPEGLV